MRLGTPHTIDVPFVFGTLDTFRLTDLTAPDAVAVSQRMQHAWAEFLRDRTPGADWARYTTEDRAVMLIGAESVLVRDPDRARREAWGPL